MTAQRDGYGRVVDDVPDQAGDPDEMQQRLDDLEEGIEEARRQAEDDDLLPAEGEVADGPPLFPEAVPPGDRSIETPVDDSDVDAGG